MKRPPPHAGVHHHVVFLAASGLPGVGGERGLLVDHLLPARTRFRVVQGQRQIHVDRCSGLEGAGGDLHQEDVALAGANVAEFDRER